MSYLVLARKYRPQRFDDVIEQEHITRTLANAISADRLAHAILFSGPRGTGKTTVARILAKCVNCAEGPSPEPCNECRSCREITDSRATDVFEIDGASNNKVENVRELRENAKYLPAHSPYKIYIIDEVHMLSDAAFNALLKVLEEPPGHVMFFFATTEPHKIPITILSRCQRHDFRRVPLDALVSHMSGICREEGISVDAEGLTLVAREADGSVRDALSLLDHILACAAGPIETRDILDVLGGIDRRDLFALSEAVFANETGTVLEIVDRCYIQGQQMTKLFGEILAHFRNLLVVRMGGGPETLADVASHEINAMKQQTAGVSPAHVHQILDILFKEEAAVRHSSQPKIALEMALLRVLQATPVLSFDELIEKLDLLRSEAEEAPLSAPPTGASARPTVPDRRQEEKTPGSPVAAAPSSNGLQEAVAPDPGKAAGAIPPCVESAPEDSLKTEPEAPEPEARSSKLPETPEAYWQSIIDKLTDKQPSLAACLSECRLQSVEKGRVSIELPPSQFHINWIKRENNRTLLREICCEQLGEDAELHLLDKAPEQSASAGNGKENTERMRQEALNHPMVSAAMKLFHGRIVDVKIL